MSRNKIILIVGIVLASMPFLGFPSAWKNVFYVLAGGTLVVIATAVHVRRKKILQERGEVVTEVFVESNRERI